MTNRIVTSLVIAALMAGSSAFARPFNPADPDSPVAQVRTDVHDSRCVLGADDSRCQPGY